MKGRGEALGVTDLLIYVEDPGAANFVARLPSALGAKGFSVLLGTRGKANPYLLEQGIDSLAIPESMTADNLLESCKPRVLLVGTSEDPETLGLELVSRARQKGISHVGVVDCIANADFRFRGSSFDPLAFSPEWLLVPDEPTKRAYDRLGFPEQRIVVVGHPRLQEVREQARVLEEIGLRNLRLRLFPEAKESQKIVVFLSEVSTGLNPEQFKRSEHYTLSGRGESLYRTEVVVEEFLDAVAPFGSDVYSVLRLHPKNERGDLARYHREFDRVSRSEPALEVVYASDLVVGMTTSLLQEAAFMGKKTLAIVPREEERAWVPDSVECVSQRSSIRTALKRLLFEKSLPGVEVPERASEPLEKMTAFLAALISAKESLHHAFPRHH